jgi:hypothetical protein
MPSGRSFHPRSTSVCSERYGDALPNHAFSLLYERFDERAIPVSIAMYHVGDWYIGVRDKGAKLDYKTRLIPRQDTNRIPMIGLSVFL